MRLITSTQIETITVSKYQADRAMIYLGQTSGSIMCSMAEAEDLHQKIGAILPARALPAIDRFLRAVRKDRAARNRCRMAKTEAEQQSANEEARAAGFELDQAMTAMDIAQTIKAAA